MKRQSLPTISVVTADSLQDFKGTSNVVVIGYFAPNDCISHETFKSVAEAMQVDYLFGIVNDNKLAKAEQINVPSIALYKDFDEGKNVFELTHDSQAITAFVKAASTPLVVEFLPELHASYVTVSLNTHDYAIVRADYKFQAGLPLGYVFVEAAEMRALISETVEPLAKKFKDRIQFGIVDVKIFDSLADDLHLKLDEWPAFAIREPVRNQRFPLNQRQQLSKHELDSFVQDFLDGKLMPTIKSEPVPETQEGPVTVVVGYSFEDLVINNEKDVLLEYYTQSCGPCKALAPTFEKLARLYSSSSTSSDRVTIAKIDAEANDVPDNIRGFPTLKLFPAGSKESPVLYTGSRTIEDMANFVRDNGKHKIHLRLNRNMDDQIMVHQEL